MSASASHSSSLKKRPNSYTENKRLEPISSNQHYQVGESQDRQQQNSMAITGRSFERGPTQNTVKNETNFPLEKT
jgi:hypothetical protein